ncbi:MAG: ThiF family adenylyltransferase [Desulfovibrio sp.]|jgi:adenylyltransferase/sulfurtransferase|nr:ThiF family adenylyltransferase [Desulfovibrio sp.]
MKKTAVAPPKAVPPELDRKEILRYSRHLLLPEVGLTGQKKLKGGGVLLVGAGGLGSPAAMYLAAAGVGHIGIIDNDDVDESNLQRQIIHGTEDIGRPKADSAREGIHRINPHVRVTALNETLSSANALDIFRDFDIIVDGTDNFAARYLINDACALLGKPDVYGAVYQFEGQATVFDARRGGCLRCLMPEPPAPEDVPTCGEGGILGVLPCIVGGIQATEAIQLILSGSSPLINKLLAFDAWTMRFHTFDIPRSAACPLCGEHPRIRELTDYERFCGSRRAPLEEPVEEIGPKELKALLAGGAKPQIIDVRLPEELKISVLPGAKSIPLKQLARRMDEISPAHDAIFVCKVGEKSALAIEMLREEGYPGRMLNLRGGMNAWAREVDTAMPVY